MNNILDVALNAMDENCIKQHGERNGNTKVSWINYTENQRREVMAAVLDAVELARGELTWGDIMDGVRRYGNHMTNLQIIAQLDKERMTPETGEAQRNDDDMRSEWLAAGGEIHGPIVETVTMPEAEYFRFRMSLAATSEDTKRLDYIERRFEIATTTGRYLADSMSWGKSRNGRTLRETIDKERCQ